MTADVVNLKERKRDQVLGCGKCDSESWYLLPETLEVQCYRCQYVPDSVGLVDNREEVDE